MRDLKADLELCEKARDGLWYIDSITSAGAVIKSRDLTLTVNVRVGGCYPNNEKYTRDCAEFIAAAREGWPIAIQRAIAAEARVKELEAALEKIKSSTQQYRCTCGPLTVPVGVPIPKGAGECQRCYVIRIAKQALGK